MRGALRELEKIANIALVARARVRASSWIWRMNLSRLGVIAAAAGLLLASCTDSGTSSPGAASPPDLPQEGAPDLTLVEVELAGIPGRDLDLRSAWSRPSSITGQSTEVSVSSTGPQLLLVSDPTNQVRAIAFSWPGDRQVTIDPSATAEALVLLTPGIFDPSPQVLADRASDLRSLSSFDNLVEVVQERLAEGQPIDRSAANIDAALAQVLLSSNVASPARGTYRTASASSLLAEDRGGRVDLTHSAWRWINLYRRETGSNSGPGSIEGRFSGLTALPGATPLTLESLFTDSVGNPNRAADRYSSPPDDCVETIEYWLTGPGLAPTDLGLVTELSQALPEGELSRDYKIVSSFTLADYVLKPLAEAMLGITGLSTPALADIAGQTSLALSLPDLAEASVTGDPAAVQASLVDFGLALLPILASDLATGTRPAFGIAPGTWGLAGPALTLASLSLLPAQLDLAMSSWRTLPTIDYLVLDGLSEESCAEEPPLDRIWDLELTLTDELVETDFEATCTNFTPCPTTEAELELFMRNTTYAFTDIAVQGEAEELSAAGALRGRLGHYDFSDNPLDLNLLADPEGTTITLSGIADNTSIARPLGDSNGTLRVFITGPAPLENKTLDVEVQVDIELPSSNSVSYIYTRTSSATLLIRPN